MKRFINLMVIGIIIFFLSACIQDSIKIKMRLDNLNGLKKNDRVIFKGRAIGIVEKINASDNGNFVAVLAIDPDFSGAVTEYSKFYLTKGQGGKDKKTVSVEMFKKGGIPLKNGSIVKVASKSWTDQISKGFKDSVGAMKDLAGEVKKNFKNIQKSAKYKKLTNDLEKLEKQMKKSGKEAHEEIRHKLLPQLKKRLEELKEQFKDFGKEKQLKPLEEKVRKIQRI